MKAAWSKGKSIKINCTLPDSRYFFLILETTFIWKLAQWGHVNEENILILTSAVSGPTEIIFLSNLFSLASAFKKINKIKNENIKNSLSQLLKTMKND